MLSGGHCSVSETISTVGRPGFDTDIVGGALELEVAGGAFLVDELVAEGFVDGGEFEGDGLGVVIFLAGEGAVVVLVEDLVLGACFEIIAGDVVAVAVDGVHFAGGSSVISLGEEGSCSEDGNSSNEEEASSKVGAHDFCFVFVFV